MNSLPQASCRVIADISMERLRQIETEGWSADHDDEHVAGEIAQAAASYVLWSTSNDAKFLGWAMKLWPWEKKAWKPTGPRRDLVKAGALIVAEIERLDRAAARHTRIAA